MTTMTTYHSRLQAGSTIEIRRVERYDWLEEVVGWGILAGWALASLLVFAIAITN